MTLESGNLVLQLCSILRTSNDASHKMILIMYGNLLQNEIKDEVAKIMENYINCGEGNHGNLHEVITRSL
jgi:hypothetical protein